MHAPEMPTSDHQIKHKNEARFEHESKEREKKKEMQKKEKGKRPVTIKYNSQKVWRIFFRDGV